MNLIKEKFDIQKPLLSILSEDWKHKMMGCDNVSFDNLNHFIYTVSKLCQREKNSCNMSYEDAIKKLIKKESDFPKSEQKFIRNLVRKNLFKRGLITQEIYENFKYTTDGTQLDVDVGKYVSGEPDCVITPSKEYIDFFYELYISISYPYHVKNSTVRNNVAKLLATVEELERQRIFIKINVVLCVDRPTNQNNKLFSLLPIFSHKDFKNVDVMSSVVNDRLLRKFYFAILEELYQNNLLPNYGFPMDLSNTINIGEDLNEIELFEKIHKYVGA